MFNELAFRFSNLLDKLNAKNSEYEYNLLKEHYSVPKRYYHTLEEHIFKVLLEFDNVKHLATNPDALELAICYHDAIYDTKRKDNEEKSAELLLPLELRTEISSQVINDAYTCIIATKHQSISGLNYKFIPYSIDEQIIMDCDLASLGKSEKEFNENSLKIRKEYLNVPKETYCKKRIKIFEQFLDKKNIYNTAFFKDRYEQQAIINLTNEIRSLEKNILH